MTREEILSKAKQILFDTEMIRATLAGKKTATRQPVKPQPESKDDVIYKSHECGKWFLSPDDDTCPETEVKSPYKVGDYLYV